MPKRNQNGGAFTDYLMITAVIASVCVPLVDNLFGRRLIKSFYSQRDKLVGFLSQKPKHNYPVPNYWFSAEKQGETGGGGKIAPVGDVGGKGELPDIGDMPDVEDVGGKGDLPDVGGVGGKGKIPRVGNVGGKGNVGGGGGTGGGFLGGRISDSGLSGEGFFVDKRESSKGETSGAFQREGKGLRWGGATSISSDAILGARGEKGKKKEAEKEKVISEEGEKGDLTKKTKGIDESDIALPTEEGGKKGKFDWWFLIKIILLLLIFFLVIVILLGNLRRK